MVDTSKIRSSPDVATLRDAVADAFEEISNELSLDERVTALEAKVP